MNLGRRKFSLILCLGLAAITALCYLPATGHQFINVDDPAYITENVHVKSGLTWQNLNWAFRTGYASNWHPITWISHMVDCQLYGVAPSGHHFTNVLFHSVNTALVFLVLFLATGRVWPSAFVAAFFGWHPVHVESVAWASERKDVLSTFFWLLTMLSYVRYTRLKSMVHEFSDDSRHEAPGSRRSTSHYLPWYFLTLLLFALGLMSKPMVVTLPFVLVLIDFWPLRRLELADPRVGRARMRSLWVEKIPFFALSIASSVVTYIAQDKGGATSSLAGLPLLLRIENSLIAYRSYIGETFWPARLCLFYPYSNHPSFALVLASAVLLIATTLICLRFVKSYPFLAVGWFWFVGTLVPVIGLVQVGSQSMADRYMYIPGIGLSLMLVWGIDIFLRRWPKSKTVVITSGLAALGLCVAFTSVQLGYWQDGVSLGRHGVEAAPKNHLAYNELAGALDEAGHYDEAYACCLKAVALEANSAESHYNLAAMLMRRGDTAGAIIQYRLALEGNPRFGNAAHGLGNACYQLGLLDEATAELSRAARLEPDNSEVLTDFGTALLAQNNISEATRQLSKAVDLNPHHLAAQRNLGVALAQQGRVGEALPHFEQAVKLAPDNPELHYNFGLALLDSGSYGLAEAQFAACVRLRPQESRFHHQLAVASMRGHKTAQAVNEYQETLPNGKSNP